MRPPPFRVADRERGRGRPRRCASIQRNILHRVGATCYSCAPYARRGSAGCARTPPETILPPPRAHAVPPVAQTQPTESSHDLRTESPRRRQGEESQRAGVHPGRHRGARHPRARAQGAEEVRGRGRPRASRRTRARHHVPRPVDRRRRQAARQPRLPRPVQQRDRPLQGRPALRFHRQPLGPQVPRLRAGLQELPHHAPDGRRQGRLGLQPEGPLRRGGHALLPELHDRALPPHRPGHGRPGRRHERGRPRDRLPLRPVQAHRERVHGRAHRQGPLLRRLAHPSRGDRLRRRLLRREHARHEGRHARGQGLLDLRLPPSPSRSPTAPAGST